MKKISLSILALVVVAFAFYAFKGGEAYETLKIGDKAPMADTEMESTDGEMYSLKSLAKSNGTLVIFSCNTCPFVIQWEDRYPGLAELAEANEIGFTLINSNEAKRRGDDSMDEMINHATEKGYEEVPYLVDENSALANAFGAKTTPHVFLFDKDWKLVYEGSIDDNGKDAAAVKNAYLNNALNNLANGKKIDPNNTKSIGCSIKREKV